MKAQDIINELNQDEEQQGREVVLSFGIIQECKTIGELKNRVGEAESYNKVNEDLKQADINLSLVCSGKVKRSLNFGF